MSYAHRWGKISSPDKATQKLYSGPLAIIVAGLSNCWRFYSGGVLTSWDRCPTEPLDHGVVIVGYEEGKTTMKKTHSCTTELYLRPPADCNKIKDSC